MNLSAEWQSDWGCPYPFRMAVLESEHDEQLGQWSVTLALFGLSVSLVWEYADTPLKQQLREQMADESWLKHSHVYLPHADYEKMKSAADWAKANGWQG